MNSSLHWESQRPYINPYYDTALGVSGEGIKQLGLPMGTTSKGEIQFIMDGIEKQLAEQQASKARRSL